LIHPRHGLSDVLECRRRRRRGRGLPDLGHDRGDLGNLDLRLANGGAQLLDGCGVSRGTGVCQGLVQGVQDGLGLLLALLRLRDIVGRLVVVPWLGGLQLGEKGADSDAQ